MDATNKHLSCKIFLIHFLNQIKGYLCFYPHSEAVTLICGIYKVEWVNRFKRFAQNWQTSMQYTLLTLSYTPNTTHYSLLYFCLKLWFLSVI